MLGGGVSILDAAIDRLERSSDGSIVVHLRRTDIEGELAIEVDDVISATGFVAPLGDLPDLGLTVFGASKLPVVTPWWESASIPGIHVAGTLGQAAKGLQRHGIPANSGAVHGARYNARALAGHLAETTFRIAPERAHLAPDRVVPFVVRELSEAPELFHQRGYLARVLEADPAGGLRDHGVQPLAATLDGDGPDALAFTLEADGSGAIYPVLFTRQGGKITERTIEPNVLADYDTHDARAVVTEMARLIEPAIPTRR